MLGGAPAGGLPGCCSCCCLGAGCCFELLLYRCGALPAANWLAILCFDAMCLALFALPIASGTLPQAATCCCTFIGLMTIFLQEVISGIFEIVPQLFEFKIISTAQDFPEISSFKFCCRLCTLANCWTTQQAVASGQPTATAGQNL